MKRRNHSGDIPFVCLDNVSKSFGKTPVLRNVSLSIYRGDFVSIIGPSGSGKSTLLRCINALEIIDAGTLTVGESVIQREIGKAENLEDIHRAAHQFRQKIGMVFQNFNLFPHKTVLENVMLAPMVVKGLSKSEAKSVGMLELDKVGLEQYAKRYPNQLSGGQAQRAAIARALAMSPQAMLYDEPTSSLDPELVGEVLEVMRDLDREGMTQIVVTHEMSFAQEASDYIIFMDEGQIVEILDEDNMISEPGDERTRRFLQRFRGAMRHEGGIYGENP